MSLDMRSKLVHNIASSGHKTESSINLGSQSAAKIKLMKQESRRSSLPQILSKPNNIGIKSYNSVIKQMNINLHKETIPQVKPTFIKPKEDDYIVVDPNTQQQIVSPLKFLDDKPSITDVDYGLYVLKEEFIMNHIPYEQRDEKEQQKINHLMALKAQDIVKFSEKRV